MYYLMESTWMTDNVQRENQKNLTSPVHIRFIAFISLLDWAFCYSGAIFMPDISDVNTLERIKFRENLKCDQKLQT